ncbi:GNAT family N-acetyltransferase [Phormidesmis sp. 146-12]
MPRFETDRLLIRDWNPAEDAEQAFEIYRDPEIFRFFRTAFSKSAGSPALYLYPGERRDESQSVDELLLCKMTKRS